MTKQSFSATFVFMAALFCVCLVASNLFAGKVFSLWGITLSGAVIIFPVSYILNDCLSEVYGYRKTRLVIWMGFLLNFFFILVAQLVIALPAAPFWTGDEAFSMVFGTSFRATFASLLAFLVGSTFNAMVMSRMKLRDRGRRFGLRAILSSVAGETVDSCIFVPIMFFSMGIKGMLTLMAGQIVVKVLYEVLILPLTTAVTKYLKVHDGTDAYDEGISYNPFRITDF